MLLCLTFISACLFAVNPLQTLRTDPPRLPAFLHQPDYFLSFDKWLLSLKRMKKRRRIKEKMKPSESFMALTFCCSGCMLYYPSFRLCTHYEQRLTLTCGILHTHSHRHKRAFQGPWWLLVWHWEREWHHEAGGGKHPWLVDSWDCQESGCQCWWSTVYR